MSGAIPCIQQWEYVCSPGDQTKVEITCSMETTRECDFVEGPDAGCDGVCFSGTTEDCSGVCGGETVEDCAGVCGGDSVIGGCDNTCGSTAVADECGVCGGDNSTCTDCAGVVNGTAVEDDCGNCGGDCEIITEGSCDCPEWDTMSDLSWVTDFETCNSLSCLNFAPGVWTDPFISCSSSQNNEVIADCNGVCGGDAVEDECGVCGGSGPDENSSCNGIFKPESRLDLQTAVDLWVDDNSLALSTYGEINTWDVSLIQDMSTLFSDKFNFNDDISNWDVSNVTTMNSMFSGANAFNQDLSSWDVSSVVVMEGMFRNAASFNGNVSNWNVSNVITLFEAFYGATSFNQDISGWDVSNVQYMVKTFSDASSFDQDISSWDLSSLEYMSQIFDGASALSSENKCAIHNTFSVFSGWQYSSWSEYCDSTSIDSVCGNVFGETYIDLAGQETNFTYLAGYITGCSDPSTSYTGEDLASLYCGLEGYSSYVQFDVITDPLFTAEGTFALYGSPANDDIQEATCSDFGWFGSFGVTEYCPVIYNLVCE